MSVIRPGCFYGIGVGPGDPELLTLKAARLLREVDWIYCPGSAQLDRSLAAQIIAPLQLSATLRPVALCMSRRRQNDMDAYAAVAAEIVAALQRGEAAAWITEGDPLFYSTFVHVRDELLRQHPAARIEIVPGITSMQAAAARAGISVASLQERVAIVPAAYGLEQLPELLERSDTIFLLKVHTALEQLLSHLARVAADFEAVYLERVGTPEERVVHDLASLRGQDLPYFSLVVLRRKVRR